MALNVRELKLNGGDDVAQKTIRDIFGGIELCPLDICEKEMELTIHQILPNYYQASDANSKDNPLYVVIPNVTIGNVWPDNIRLYDDIRFGTVKLGELINHSIVFHKGTTGLYICTNPMAFQFQLSIGCLGI